MNLFMWVGRIASDPETVSNSTSSVVKFRFAVNRTYKAEGQPDADFFQIVAFGKTAERFGKLDIKKGTKLLITGEVRNDNYTDKDGVKHFRDSFIMVNFEFLEAKGAGPAPAADQPGKPAEKAAAAPAKGDDFVPVPDDVDDAWLLL